MELENGIQFSILLLFGRLKSLNPRFDIDTYLAKFKTIKTNADKVSFVHKDLKKYSLFPKFSKDTKDDTKAVTTRELGNMFFNNGQYKEALNCYTGSAASAKTKGPVGLAYGNRSAALLRLKLYQECLEDIERALANNYPAHLKPKLQKRREKAQALLLISELSPPHEEIPTIRQNRKNPSIQSAKDCVKIETNEKFGRHVIATRDIQIGEIIAIEKPFATVLTTGQWVHCHYCLKLCYNLIPCDTCTVVGYCSEECKTNASNAYHKYECPLYFFLVNYGLSPLDALSLRLALMAKDQYDRLNDLKLALDEEYQSDRYKEVHNLMAATDKQEVERLFERAMMAAVIFHYLQSNTSFFSGRSKEFKQSFKEVIMLQLQIVPLNQWAILENICGDDEDYGPSIAKTDSFAIGLYSFMSLFSHSCYHNVEMSFYGSTAVLRAIGTIKKDQQCFVSYGLPFGVPEQESRKENLLKYFYFTCECPACANGWNVEVEDFFNSPPQDSDSDSDVVDDIELCMMEMDLCEGDVDFAKENIRKLIPNLVRCEKQNQSYTQQLKLKSVLVNSFRTLGNKRRI